MYTNHLWYYLDALLNYLKFKPECPSSRQLDLQSCTYTNECHMMRTVVGMRRPLEIEEEKTFSQMK